MIYFPIERNLVSHNLKGKKKSQIHKSLFMVNVLFVHVIKLQENLVHRLKSQLVSLALRLSRVRTSQN